MAKELSVEEAVQRAQQLQEDRIGAIRGLAQGRQSLADTRDEAGRKLAEVERETAELVAAAEREDSRLYAAALAAGWSAEELRKVGYQEPDKKARVRKRQTRKTTSSTTSGDSGDAAGVAGGNAPE
ncbi:hypothetical protein ITJ38_17465 [Agreia pratensis]|uniref:hypothetical protein n=1 Tax=Agreia pratensis TaxID=150121 RepID=UPI00188B1AB6|nr:hypothetical protein [Agreia pratensis]MBF4636202.1 hypothetical protein [Agreia pratensis]